MMQTSPLWFNEIMKIGKCPGAILPSSLPQLFGFAVSDVDNFSYLSIYLSFGWMPSDTAWGGEERGVGEYT